MRPLAFGSLLLALAACAGGGARKGAAPGPSTSPPTGTQPPRAQVGYELHRRCKSPTFADSRVISVVGTGSVDFGWHFDPSDRRPFRARVRAAARAKSIRATRYGAPCSGDGEALHVLVGEARELDAIAENLGAWLVSEDLRGEIVLILQEGLSK